MLERLKRRFLLAMLRRQNPGALRSRAQGGLGAILASAARRSRAYATLLGEAGVAPADLSAPEAILRAPILEKENTFQRFSIDELLGRDVRRDKLASVLTSSGYGSISFGFGLSDRAEQAMTPGAIDLGLQHAFGVDDRRTLLINTLPMGVVFESRAACVSNVSVREDMAFAILRQAGPLFEQIILVVDPLFGKRFLDYAEERGYDLAAQRINMVIGEETFQEPYRDYLHQRLGIEEGQTGAPLLGSSMGVGELGLNLFFETPETIAYRRACHARDPWNRQPVVFCYNPLRSWVEVHEPDEQGVGDLLVTMMDKRSTIPLPRYRTGDRVKLLDASDLEGLAPAVQEGMRSLPFPVILMYGRDRDQLAPHWHVDDFKSLQYRDASLARQLSGAFRVGERDGAPVWHVQAARDASLACSDIEGRLAELVAQRCEALGAAPLAQLRVFEYERFPYGMGLDYERKFRYGGTLVD